MENGAIVIPILSLAYPIEREIVEKVMCLNNIETVGIHSRVASSVLLQVVKFTFLYSKNPDGKIFRLLK